MFQVWRPRDGDEKRGGAFQFERLYVRITPWRIVLVGAGVATYLAGLALMLPAEFAVGRARDAVGTVWKGQVALDPGFAAGWTVRPFRSLASFAGVADAAVLGPDTDIQARVSTQNGLTLLEASGAGSMRLLSALAPQAPFACDGDMEVTAQTLALRGGRVGKGQLRSGPARCAAGGAAPSATPALAADLASDADGMSVTATGPTGVPIARIRVLKDGAVSTVIEPAAANVLPGLTPMTLDTSL